MHELARLYKIPGSRKGRKRVGRGNGSGWGLTAGRGTKGHNARSGGGVKPGFEGGQMPLQRRVPKFGFKPLNHKEYAIVNLDVLDARFEDGDRVDVKTLLERGIVKDVKYGVKVLGRGEIKKKLTVVVHAFSKSAKEKIESAGGKALTVLQEEV